MKKRKSKGVIIIGVISIIYAANYLLHPAITFFAFLLSLSYPSPFGRIPPPLEGDPSSIILGLCWLTAAFGVLKLKYYLGRILIIVLAIFGLMEYTFIGILTFNYSMQSLLNSFPMVHKQTLLVIVYIVFLLHAIYLISLIVFFTRPKVKRQFMERRIL